MILYDFNFLSIHIKEIKKSLPRAGIEPWTSCFTVWHLDHYATWPEGVWALLFCDSIILFSFWPIWASKQPRRSQTTSELNSVASITYVAMLSWALNASVSQIKHEDESSSIDLLASPQVKTRKNRYFFRVRSTAHARRAARGVDSLDRRDV